MNSTAVCLTCQESPSQPFPVKATTQRWLITSCPAGHRVGLIFQAAGWARLFERGLRRLALGDTRDAVLDAYTAFEMYLAEVPVRARYDREHGAEPRKLKLELKPAIGRAENAIGAARAAASIVSSGPPVKWNESATTAVRNNAVHGGAYPTDAEAEKLCIEVANAILAFERALDKGACCNPNTYHKAVWLGEAKEFREAHPDVNPSFVGDGSMFCWTYTEESRPSIADRIAAYRKSAAIEGLYS